MTLDRDLSSPRPNGGDSAGSALPLTSPPKRHRNRILIMIALFKLFKATLLFAAGVAAIVFRKANIARMFTQLVSHFRLDPHNHHIDAVIDRLHLITPKTMELLAVGTFFYALLFTLEGFGLYFEKVWAEYLVILEACAGIPLEIFEITRKPNLLRIGLLVVNVMIVAYLIYLRIKAHHLKHAGINDKIQ